MYHVMNFDPVELVFQNLKIVLKKEELEPLVSTNLHAGLYCAIEEISPNDMSTHQLHIRMICM